MKIAEALQKAKEGAKKEQLLRKHRKSNSLTGDFETELMYASWFNLASAYEANEMYEDAIKAYNFLVKQRRHPLTGRLRINMGNIYYSQQDYSSAIKMYKMALDQIKKGEQTIAHNIRRNIGNAFFRLGKMRDAVKSYEEVMDAAPDIQTGFNLLVCHLALGDVDNMKKDFIRLIEIPLGGGKFPSEDAEDAIAAIDSDEAKKRPVHSGSGDRLKCELSKRIKEAHHLLLAAARLIAPLLDVGNWAYGYEWVCNALKDRHEQLAVQMELEQIFSCLLL